MLITNIKGLVGLHPKSKLMLRGNEMDNLHVLENAWLLIENDLIKDFGDMESIPAHILNLPSPISAFCRDWRWEI